jgi:hypothetical protein
MPVCRERKRRGQRQTIDVAQAEHCVLRRGWRANGAAWHGREHQAVLESAGSQERVPGVPHQIVGVVEGEELATRSKLMRRAGL